MNVPLTELGIQQAKQAADLLIDFGARRIVSSDQLRAVQTARIIADALELEIEETALLREQYLGTMEGQLSKDLTAEEVPDGLHINEIRWAGGESVVDLWARMQTFLKWLDDPTIPTIVVSHGQALSCLYALLHGKSHEEIDWDVFPYGQVRCVNRSG